ncbi:MAG TPA: sugar ABC transporter permease, partial [Thermotogota bacterium]|nr:sugar ABC transporter permease [Thermotogota bacterium]
MKVRFRGERYYLREIGVAWLCLAPALGLAVVFVFIPLVEVCYLSFTNWDLLRATKSWVGWKNYEYIFKDQKFIQSIWNTLYFAGVKIPLDLVLSLFIAVLLDKRIRGLRFYRASYFAPVVIPVVAASLIWVWLFDPGLGPLNQILGLFGISPSRWL